MSVTDFLVTISSKVQTKAKNLFAPLQRNREIARRHEPGFYSDDRLLLDDVTHFIGTLSTPETRRLLSRLSHTGTASFRNWRHMAWILLLSRRIHLDGGCRRALEIRFLNFFGNLIVTAAHAAKGEQARVAVFGEGVHLLWAQGNAEAAIRVESLTNQIPKTYDVDILCGYSLGSVQGGMETHIFQEVCAKHSAVYSR